MKIQKHFVKDFETEKLDEIFGRTMADIENLIEEYKECTNLETLLDMLRYEGVSCKRTLEDLQSVLKIHTYIKDQTLVFYDPIIQNNIRNNLIPDVKLLVAFLNQQFNEGRLYLVGRYEIEFFEMLVKL